MRFILYEFQCLCLVHALRCAVGFAAGCTQSREAIRFTIEALMRGTGVQELDYINLISVGRSPPRPVLMLVGDMMLLGICGRCTHS